MTDQISPARDNASDIIRWAAIAFVVGFVIHGLDHLRRGMSASPPFIMVAGAIQGLFVAVAVAMALSRRRRAPEAAIAVGFGSAVGFTYAHLLPTFLPGYQDSFISPPHINVMWFSWLSSRGALTEIGTAIVFAIAGIRARRSVGEASVLPLHPWQGVAR